MRLFHLASLSPLGRVIIASSLTALASGLGALPFFSLSSCFGSDKATKPSPNQRPPLLVRYSTSNAAGMMLACAMLLLSEAYDDAMSSITGFGAHSGGAGSGAKAVGSPEASWTWAWAMLRVLLGLAAGVGMVVASQRYFSGGHSHGHGPDHSHGHNHGHSHGHGHGYGHGHRPRQQREHGHGHRCEGKSVDSADAKLLSSKTKANTDKVSTASVACADGPAAAAALVKGGSTICPLAAAAASASSAQTAHASPERAQRHTTSSSTSHASHASHPSDDDDEDEGDEGDVSASLISGTPCATVAVPAGTVSTVSHHSVAAVDTYGHGSTAVQSQKGTTSDNDEDAESLIAQIYTHGPTRRAALLFLVMAAHSFAEGVSLGVSWAKSPHLGSFVSSSLALHNVPEGLAVAALVVRRGSSPWAAAGWAVASSIPQPLAAVPAFLFVSFFQWLTAAGLAFAAGAMLWVPLSDLLPEACRELPPKRVAAVATATAAGMFVLAHFLHG